jgi:uncharacterized protein YuzE
MRVTYDRFANAAYIYLQKIEPGGVHRSVPVDAEDVVLDFDREGKLIGIEVLAADRVLAREFLAQAELLGPPRPLADLLDK